MILSSRLPLTLPARGVADILYPIYRRLRAIFRVPTTRDGAIQSSQTMPLSICLYSIFFFVRMTYAYIITYISSLYLPWHTVNAAYATTPTTTPTATRLYKPLEQLFSLPRLHYCTHTTCYCFARSRSNLPCCSPPRAYARIQPYAVTFSTILYLLPPPYRRCLLCTDMSSPPNLIDLLFIPSCCLRR